MGSRDLLLMIGFLRSGKLFPSAVPLKGVPDHRSLRIILDSMSEQEIALFGKSARVVDHEDMRRRAVVASWSGEILSIGTRISEVPDPGVILCLLYDVPSEEAPLPPEIFVQTLRRYALRDTGLRARFEVHVDEAGTWVPPWLTPETRRQKSQEAFDAAMKIAREHGFAHAAPLFEGVRGDCFPQAQVAIAVYELRELNDEEGALRRLNEVVRIEPRNIAARIQRANVLMRDPSREIEAASDYLAVLRELSQPGAEPSREIRDAAMTSLWKLSGTYANPRKLEAALTLARDDPERGFEALSRYVHTHPCGWDAQAHLAALALARQRFDLASKLLIKTRWLFPDDANPHFVYGQALASSGNLEAALSVLEHASALAPSDADIQRWLVFVQKKLSVADSAGVRAASVEVARHVARSLFVLIGVVREGKVYPSSMALNKLPGDVSLMLVLQALANQEQRRAAYGEARSTKRGLGPPSSSPLSEAVPVSSGPMSSGSGPPSADATLRDVAERTALLDYMGERLSPDQTVGTVNDPGVVVAALYDDVGRDESGRFVLSPEPGEVHRAVLAIARKHSEISGKLDRHLRSADATLKSRLDV